MRLAALIVGSAALAGVSAWSLGRTLSAKPEAVAEALQLTPSYQAVNFSNESEDGRRSFLLANRGPQPLRIAEVDVGCSACSSVVTNPAGRVLAPGESCELVLVLRPPEGGSEDRQVKVVHDQVGSPAIATVEVTGRRRPPYVASTSGSRVSFFDLGAPDASRSFTVVTYESGPERWFGELTCDLPECRIVPLGFHEQRIGGVVRRTYEFSIGWHELPKGHEFQGRIQAVTPTGRVDVAAVQGTRPRRRD